MRVLFLIFLFICPLISRGQTPVQCSRGDTLQCGIDALYGSKEFRASMQAALGDRFDPEHPGFKVRFHDAGWASYQLPQKLIAYAKANKLPESYFKINQWYLLEVSSDGPLKSFQVDLTFRRFGDNSVPSEYKFATVEQSRISEIPAYKVEEEKQRAAARNLPVNGFVCESEQLGLIVNVAPEESSRSFGQVLDSVLNPGKEGAFQGDLGLYKVTISDFGVKRPPQLPPAVIEDEAQLGWQIQYTKGTPDTYEGLFSAASSRFSFSRRIQGFNKIQSYCGSMNPKKDSRRQEICENDHAEELTVQTGGKKWDAPKCTFYEKMTFSR